MYILYLFHFSQNDDSNEKRMHLTKIKLNQTEL
jgi:hypothetical protein